MNQTRPLPWRSSWVCKHRTKLDGKSRNEGDMVFWKPGAMGSVCTAQGWLHIQDMFDLVLESCRILPKCRKEENPM